MAQQATSPKIEELRFKLKAEPKSRLFYQLAEELRKVKAFGEADEVLRSGLGHNPTYLAAWVSLGRVLREEDKHRDAVDAFARALQLDPGNAVAARLMADTYYHLGDKIEAIKKYKLARALMPADVELDALIDRIDDEINPVTIHRGTSPGRAESTQPGKSVDTQPPTPLPERSDPVSTADVEPMRVAHDQSPFEEPAPSYTSAAVDVEQPAGMHIDPAPVAAAEVPATWMEEEKAAEVFEPAPAPAAPSADDVANTLTMAELYVQQGFPDRAQSIYASILDRDPNNDAVRAKLDALEQSGRQPASRNAKAVKLEQWLQKVRRA